jgi:hypothetical protein
MEESSIVRFSPSSVSVGYHDVLPVPRTVEYALYSLLFVERVQIAVHPTKDINHYTGVNNDKGTNQLLGSYIDFLLRLMDIPLEVARLYTCIFISITKIIVCLFLVRLSQRSEVS